MPVKILVVNREIKAQFKNGETFTLASSDDTTHLKGSVMEKIQATHSIDVSWNASASATDIWKSVLILNPDPLGSGSVTELTRDSGDFIDDGFSDGDSLDFIANDGTSVFVGSATIFTLSGETIVFASDLGTGSGITYGAAVFGTDPQTSFALIGTQDLTALKFKFGLVENSEAINFESKVDGTEQSYYVDGIGLDDGFGNRLTAFQIGESAELFKGWQSGIFKARYVIDPRDDVQRFEIAHEFIILPYLKIDDAETVFRLTESLNTLKYVFETEFRTVLSNPNTSKIIKDDFKKGSVATFGENYNGFNTQFSVVSTVITDPLAVVIDTLEIGAVNTVTVVINSDEATFITSAPVIVYHSYLPTADVYQKNSDTFEEVWLYENKRIAIDGAPVSGTILTDVEAVLDSGSQITVTFKVSYSTAQQALLTDADDFVIAVGVGDSTLLTDVSDKTIVKAKQATYTKDTDVAGLISVTQLGFFDHPTDFLTGTGFTNYIGAVEDGILVEADFTIDLSLSAFIETLNINFVAFNPTTEDLFILQSNPVDITSQVQNVPEGAFFVQEINIDTTRGFTLAALDQFNFFKMTTSPLSGSDKPYNLQFGIKADWREWIALPDADPVFYDSSEQLNGLNKLISNYAANGYEIRIMLNAQVSNGAVTTVYNFSSPTVNIFDYDLSAGLDWVCTIETFNLLGTSLGGNISSTENTRIKVTFDSPTITVTDASLYWGIIRIEPQNNPSLPTIEPLSTLRSGVQNVLIPLVGETTTKKSISSGNLVLECLVDFTKLVQGTDYKPSSRFGLNDAAAVTGGKLKEDGTAKNKEDGDDKNTDP